MWNNQFVKAKTEKILMGLPRLLRDTLHRKENVRGSQLSDIHVHFMPLP